MGCLFVFLLILSQITMHDNAVYTIYFCLVVMFGSAIAMIVLYSNLFFYIPEHIAFLTYDFVFTAFFTIHTYAYWNHSETIRKALEMYSADWGDDDDAETFKGTPFEDEEELTGSFYVGRGGLVWIPAYPADPNTKIFK